MLLRSLASIVLALGVVPTVHAQFEDEPTGPVTVEQLVERAQARMKEHNYFSKILVSVDRSQPPLVFLLHKPQVEQPNWDKLIVGSHAPWLAKIEQLFRQNYAEPLGWKRREDTPAYLVCELQTQGDYSNFLKTQSDQGYYSELAHYDRRLRATVAYHEIGDRAKDKRFCEMAEFVRQLLAAHYGAGKDAPSQTWIVEGFAAYLAGNTGDDPKVLDQRYVSPRQLEVLARASTDPKQRDVYLLPIAELAATRNIDQVWTWMNKRAEQLGVEVDADRMWPTFHAQATLWMHYLHDGDDGKHKPALMKFLTSAMKGSGGVDAFRSAFEGVALNDLDRSFYRWVYAKFEATHAGEKLERRWIDELFVPRTGAAVASAASAPDAGDLRPPRDDVAAAHGALLQAARHGELETALKQLGELEERGRNGPFGRRLASDVDRLKRLIALRDAYLADLIASGGKLECEYDGKKLSAKPLRVENGIIALGENRQKVANLPLAALDPLDVARSVPKSLADAPDGWIRAYPYVLAGDARWKSVLKSDAPDALALKSDALEWYPRLLQIGDAAQRLIALANGGPPADANGAKTCLEAIAELRKQYGEFNLVKDRSAALAKLATLALEKQFVPASLSSWLHGRVEDLGNGAVRVTYEFEREEEAQDFSFDAKYEAEWHEYLKTDQRDAPVSNMLVAGGAFRGGGSFVYRLPIAFEAPLKVSAGIQFAEATDANIYAAFIRVAGADDAQGNFVALQGMGGLFVVDHPTAMVQADLVAGGVQLDPDHIYEFALTIDGKRATSSLDGQKQKELPCGSRKRGGVFFAVFGNSAVAIHRFVVEGKLALEETRAAWAARRLAELGFSK